MPATQAKTQFAEMIDQARKSPVTITRNNRPVAVVLSPEEYALLERFDDQYWGEEAKKAEKEGSLSVAESKKFMDDLLAGTA